MSDIVYCIRKSCITFMGVLRWWSSMNLNEDDYLFRFECWCWLPVDERVERCCALLFVKKGSRSDERVTREWRESDERVTSDRATVWPSVLLLKIQDPFLIGRDHDNTTCSQKGESRERSRERALLFRTVRTVPHPCPVIKYKTHSS